MKSDVKIYEHDMHISLICVLFVLVFSSTKSYGQNKENTVNALMKSGFENIGHFENDKENVYLIQNSKHLIEPDGIKEAISIINKNDSTEVKNNRVILLDNNVPQLSVLFDASGYKVSQDLGYSVSELNKVKRTNSSLFKVNLVFYPEFKFRNYVINRMYDVMLSIDPTIEISFWKGMKFTGQIIFPIFNDYGSLYDQVRPGFITLSQTFRLPYQTFVTGHIGMFGDFRSGISFNARHYLLWDRHFTIDARFDYTQSGYWENWAYYHGTKWRTTGYLGASYWWNKYATQFSLRGERYLVGEYGLRGDIVRHFKHASIGIWYSKIEKKQFTTHSGVNGGFQFQVALPPYRSKRHGNLPRVSVGDYGFRYNTNNEKIYGFSFKNAPDENILRDNRTNSNFINQFFNH